MKHVILAVALGMLPTVASATPSVFVEGAKAHIRYGDLDLQSQAGRAKLTGRIHFAAQMMCTDNQDALTLSPTRAECMRSIVSSGLTAMDVLLARQAG
jgi:UrcA family protein